VAAFKIFVVLSLLFMPASAWARNADGPGTGLDALESRLAHAYSLMRVDETLYFNGVIDDPAVTEIRENIERVKKLVIKSPGGRETASLDLAELIQEHHLTVEIVDYCTSGCATAVLVAGSGNIKTNGALIGLHWSAVAIGDYAVSHGIPLTPELEGRIARYRKLYKAAGIDLNVLTEAGREITLVAIPEGQSAADRAHWVSKKKMWIPTDCQFARYGLQIQNSRQSKWTEKVATVMAASLKFSKRDVVVDMIGAGR